VFFFIDGEERSKRRGVSCAVCRVYWWKMWK
jgi:hypothetical protein